MPAIADMFGGEWRPHYLHGGYFFSRDGRAASVLDGRPRLLIGCSSGQMGYRAVTIASGPYRNKRLYIHRAVCELFNGPAPPGLQCRHLDGNRFNNAADNLAWGTQIDNESDKILHGTRMSGERNPMSKLTLAQVQKIRELVAGGATQRSLCKSFGVSPMTISRIVRRELWK